MGTALYRFRPFALAMALATQGCALKATHVSPAAPYDFGHLQRTALFAQAAYADDAAIRALCGPRFTTVYIHVIPATNNKFFVATDTTTASHLISIAGTANLQNVLLDADQTQEFVPGLNIALHRGFARGARLIYDEVRSHLVPGYRVTLTGHSLGGAEALILGMMLKSAGMPPAHIMTFGQPKVTNAAGNEAFHDLPLTRVVNQEDIVPLLPLGSYRHLGPELVLFPGPDYSVVAERPLNPAVVTAAWDSMLNRQAPPPLPHHYIANYLLNLQPKQESGRNVEYPAPFSGR